MKLQSIWNVIRPYAPRKIYPFVTSIYNVYMRTYCWYAGLLDQRYIKQTGFANLPSATLRYRVRGDPGIDNFLKCGKSCAQSIESALIKIGKDLNSFQNILDFGCGCGNTLMWFANSSQQSNFYGTDIDKEAISWCSSNLKFAKFSVNNPLPPLEYSPDMFDLIYAISVFTHLDEDYQFRWLSELKRITKPKGYLLLTVHGKHCWKNLPYEDVTKIKKRGFHFTTSNVWKGIFPDWYQAAYHTREYILDKWSRYLDILYYIPGGMNDFQDLIILQKKIKNMKMSESIANNRILYDADINFQYK